MLVSYDFNSLYPIAQIDINSICPKIETTYPIKKRTSDIVGSLSNSGKRNEFNKCAFLTVKDHHPENLVFQHLPVKENSKNPYKNTRLKKIKRMRNCMIIELLIKVDFVEIAKCGGVILEVFERFLCHKLQ